MQNVPKSLIQRHREWVDVVNQRDIEAYANLLSEKAVWIPPGQPPIIGRQAFKQWLKPFFNDYRYDFTITGEQFNISGDWALERAEFTSRMTPVNGENTMEHSGSFTVIWHREHDNRWYIDRYVDDTGLQS